MSPSDVFEPAEFTSVFFFLFLCKKGERKKDSSERGPSLLKNNAAEARACKPGVPTCVFLSEKSTLLRVRGAMPWARIFCLWEGRRSRRWTGRGWAAGSTRELWVEQRGRNDTREVRVKEGEKVIFLFLGEKIRRCFLYLLGSDNSKSAAIAALGYRHCRRGKRRAQLRHGVETQLVVA